MHDLCVAPAPVDQRRLAAPALAEAMTRVTTDPRYSERANALSSLVRAEHGTRTAADLVTELASSG